MSAYKCSFRIHIIFYHKRPFDKTTTTLVRPHPFSSLCTTPAGKMTLCCELGPSEAQAQNTSKNDDLENGPIFVFDFFMKSTYVTPNKAGMCSVLVVKFSKLAAIVKVLWLQ